MRRPWLIAVLFLAFVSLFPNGFQTQARRPNILFAIADDWSWPHAGAYGDGVVRTPAFDRIAAEGALFTRAFCAAPSCTPSRGAILTGRAIHQLEEGGNLWSALPGKFKVYPEWLEQAGYSVGMTRKGWGPGSLEGTGRKRNPAGPEFADFAQFLNGVSPGKPFCFWFGGRDPHRPYEKGSGIKAGMDPAKVAVPAWLPDTPEVRSDILDYYFEVQRFDRDVGALVALLEAGGHLDNTLIIITSDNGMPFPRAKANLYDSGSRMPLAIRWPGRVAAGQRIEAFAGLADIAPTLLDAAGIKPPAEMTGRSLLPVLAGRRQARQREHVIIERERHANVRKGDLGYPARAVRNARYLYIRNFRPERWPAGDPEMYKAVGPYGDVDSSPTKEFILGRRADAGIAPYFKLAFEKRPAEELYDLAHDPEQVRNVADQRVYARARNELRATLSRWMKKTNDPRAAGDDDRWDRYRYFGPPAQMPVSQK